MKIGLVSDTHGKMHPAVVTLLDGVDLILHAGDIGRQDIITELEVCAPVKAVTGNVDGFPLIGRYPEYWHEIILGHSILMTHILPAFAEDAVLGLAKQAGLADAPDILIYGHSHQQRIEKLGRTLTINPGAAGPRRFQLKPCIAYLELHMNQAPKAWLHELPA